jgi:hypothetical protein
MKSGRYSAFESRMVGLRGQHSNFLRADLVPRLRELLAATDGAGL